MSIVKNTQKQILQTLLNAYYCTLCTYAGGVPLTFTVLCAQYQYTKIQHSAFFHLDSCKEKYVMILTVCTKKHFKTILIYRQKFHLKLNFYKSFKFPQLGSQSPIFHNFHLQLSNSNSGQTYIFGSFSFCFHWHMLKNSGY